MADSAALRAASPWVRQTLLRRRAFAALPHLQRTAEQTSDVRAAGAARAAAARPVTDFICVRAQAAPRGGWRWEWVVTEGTLCVARGYAATAEDAAKARDAALRERGYGDEFCVFLSNGERNPQQQSRAAGYAVQRAIAAGDLVPAWQRLCLNCGAQACHYLHCGDYLEALCTTWCASACADSSLLNGARAHSLRVQPFVQGQKRRRPHGRGVGGGARSLRCRTSPSICSARNGRPRRRQPAQPARPLRPGLAGKGERGAAPVPFA